MARTAEEIKKLREDGQMIQVDLWNDGALTYLIESVKGTNESFYSWQHIDMVRIGWATTTRIPNSVVKRIQDLIRGDV